MSLQDFRLRSSGAFFLGHVEDPGVHLTGGLPMGSSKDFYMARGGIQGGLESSKG